MDFLPALHLPDETMFMSGEIVDNSSAIAPAPHRASDPPLTYTNRQLQSPFFNELPCELRVEVYKLLFAVPVHIEVGEHASWDDLKEQFRLLLICKRLCIEAQEIPFETNVFCDTLWAYKECRINDRRARNIAPRICHLQLNFHAWRYLDFKCPLVNDFSELREQIASFKHIFHQGDNLRSLDVHVHEYNGNKDLLERALHVLESLTLEGCRVTITNWAAVGVSEKCVEEMASAMNGMSVDALNGDGKMWGEQSGRYRVVPAKDCVYSCCGGMTLRFRR